MCATNQPHTHTHTHTHTHRVKVKGERVAVFNGLTFCSMRGGGQSGTGSPGGEGHSGGQGLLSPSEAWRFTIRTARRMKTKQTKGRKRGGGREWGWWYDDGLRKRKQRQPSGKRIKKRKKDKQRSKYKPQEGISVQPLKAAAKSRFPGLGTSLSQFHRP